MFTSAIRGLQLIADFFKLFLKALEAAQPEAITDCISIAKQWLAETVNEAGAVKVSGWTLLLANSDPWRDSRQMLRAVQLRWNGKL